MLKKLKLKQKLILLVAGFGLIGVLFFTGTSYLRSTQELREQINQTMTSKFESLYAKVESFLKTREAILMKESALIRHNLDDEQAVLKYLAEHYEYLKKE